VRLLRLLKEDYDQVRAHLKKTLIIISGFASAEIDAGFLELAEQGYAEAQEILGVAYASGYRVPEDTVIACVWANLAGANG